MSPERDEHLTDESGVALVAALLAVVILTGLAVVFVAMAVSTSRSTAFSRDFEIAIHVAEAGADEVIARVNWDKDYVTTDSSDARHELDLNAHPDEEAQREWAIAQARDDDGLEPLTTGVSGAGFGIRPWDPNAGEAHDLIFGVSFVPSRDRPERVRVIKLTFQREFFQPQHGIQTCGDIDIGGNAEIRGELGSVHANGTVTTTGSSYYVEQGITDQGDEDCPEIHAEDLYPRAGPPFTCYEANDPDCAQLFDPDGNAVLWWDLCPDGTARKVGSAPCEGEVVYPQNTHNHKGWSRVTTGQWPGWHTDNIQSGVFYVHESNVRIAGSGSAVATVIVAKDEDDEGRSGNTHFRGSSDVVPALEGITLVMDRDLQLRGTATGGGIDAGGLIAVGEQAELDGTANFRGPVYIRDDPHTLKSWVSKSTVKGNFTVTYDMELDITLLGSIRVTAWNELR